MKALIAKNFLLCTMALSPLYSFAADIMNTTGITNTQEQAVNVINSGMPVTNQVNTDLTQDQIVQQAAMWGMSTQDYQKYLDLMKNTPAGKWYPQLDPAEVLGDMATNDQDRQKYALMEAKIAHDQISGIIAFDQARIQAFKELYPNLKPIDLSGSGSSGNNSGTSLTPQQTTPFAEPGDHFFLFTSLDNQQSAVVISQLIALQKQTPSLIIYIYIVGTSDPVSIEAWAKANQLPQSDFKNNTMFLDVDHGDLQKVMSNYQSNYSLPVVVRQRDGQQTVLSNSGQLAAQVAAGGGQ